MYTTRIGVEASVLLRLYTRLEHKPSQSQEQWRWSPALECHRGNLGVVGPTEKLEEVTFFIINEGFQVLSFRLIDHSKVSSECADGLPEGCSCHRVPPRPRTHGSSSLELKLSRYNLEMGPRLARWPSGIGT